MSQKTDNKPFKYKCEPRSGVCAICGKELEAYHSKYYDANTGEMYCSDWPAASCAEKARSLFLSKYGFHYYSDG